MSDRLYLHNPPQQQFVKMLLRLSRLQQAEHLPLPINGMMMMVQFHGPQAVLIQLHLLIQLTQEVIIVLPPMVVLRLHRTP